MNFRRENIFENLNDIEKNKTITKIIVGELNRVIINCIQNSESDAIHLQTDFSPRIEASWKVNSLVETVVKKEYKYGIPLNELPEEYLDRPSDKLIQYIGKPILQLRCSNPLPPIISSKEANIFNYSVPVYDFDPHITLGYTMERRHITNIPGKYKNKF